MVEAIDRILRYSDGKTYEDLVNDDMMYYAVVKNIEIIGEAANMLTAEFQEAHGNTIPPYLPPEKSLCRSRSNS